MMPPLPSPPSGQTGPSAQAFLIVNAAVGWLWACGVTWAVLLIAVDSCWAAVLYTSKVALFRTGRGRRGGGGQSGWLGAKGFTRRGGWRGGGGGGGSKLCAEQGRRGGRGGEGGGHRAVYGTGEGRRQEGMR